MTVAAGAALDATTYVNGHPYAAVTGGLTLNGSVLLGNTSGSVTGELDFRGGSQTLGGSGVVTLGASTGNALYAIGNNGNAPVTLTVGGGVRIQGGSGVVAGYYTTFSTDSVVLNGVIDVPAGATLTVGGSNWANNGTITAAGATVFLDGSLTFAALGSFAAAGATVYLRGTLNNTAATLPLSPAIGSWLLRGGAIAGGTITSSGGARLGLTGSGGTLAGVTVAAGAALDATAYVNGGPYATVTGGLTLNGAAYLGNASGSVSGGLSFRGGNQTLGGSGVVTLGASTGNYLYAQGNNGNAPVTLTVGGGARIQGGSGTITSYYSNDAVVLTGVLAVGGGGVVTVSPDLRVDDATRVQLADTATLAVTGSLLGTTTNPVLFTPRGTVRLAGSGTAAVPQRLEVMSPDAGAVAAGFTGNFAYRTVVLGANTYVRLVDQSENAAGAGAEVLYADSVVVPSGSTLDLNGLVVYARALQQNGSVINGVITVLPDSGALALGTATAGSIAPAGQLDEWTFFGRAGSAVTVRVNVGSAASPAPVSPAVNWARARLVAPDGTVLATAASATAGATVILSGVGLPADGVYKILIDAAPGHAASTGNYVLTAWDTTPTVRPLVPNETATGTLGSPFAVDRWTFAAAAGEQVRFHLLGTAAGGLTFTLDGPGGYAGFTDLTADSPLLTLPADGTYTLTVRGPSGATGAYAFVLRQTAVTTLTLDTPFTGTLLGGQPRLFRVEVPDPRVLSVVLADAAAAGRTELYVRYGAPPTREAYDFAATGPGRSQSLLVPSATPGAWFVLVYGESVPQPGEFTLTARGSAARVTSVTPERAGNATPTLVTVTGAGFTPGTTVKLVAPNGTTYTPVSFSVDLYTQVTATFAAGLPAGTYSVRVTNGGDSDTLADAVRVTAGGEGVLETNLILPAALGRRAVATLYVEFANTGDAAMPAPLLSLQSADADGSDRPILTLDESRVVENFWTGGLPPGTGNSVLILGSGAQPGVLNPGERVRVPVYFLGLQLPWDTGDAQVELEVRYWTEDDATPVDWAGRQEALRPPLLGADQWAAVYGNLTGGLATTGDYVRMLNANARYLARLGESVTGVDDLWNFEVQQAYGYTAVPTLDSAVDAAVPAPGVSLDFARRYGNAIQSRYADGPLGRGWFTPWQTRLTSTGGGTLVQIAGEGGSAHTFQRDSRNGSYFSGTGDSATLAAVGGGAFELRAVGGTVTRFRADGRIESVRDPNGNAVTAGYDAAGRLTSLTHTSGASLTLTYTAAGRVGTVVDSAGRTTTYGYDATATYLTSVTTADGKVTRYAYQTTGAAQVRNALLSVERGGTTQFFTYDARGRLDASYLTGNAQFVDYAYSDTGLVTASDAAGTTSLFFDHNGLLAKVTDPLGFITSNEFDADLRLSRTVGPTGESQSFTWCACGSLTSVTDELGQTTTFAYDNPFKRMTSFVDAKGQRTDYGYDDKGNLLTTVYANGSVERLSNYTAAGLPGVSRNRRGQTLSYTYNAAGQVTRQTFADGTFVTFGYDARGNLGTVTDGAEVTTYAYRYAADGDRLARVTDPTGRYLDYEYDGFGRRTRMTDKDGYATKYEYDAAGRLYRLRDAADAVLVTYSYDASGRLSRVDKGNGTFTTYDYDAAGQLLSLKNWRNATTLNSRFDYTYDARGRRVTMATLDGTWTYGYDGTGQLTRAVFASLNTAVIPHQDLQYFYDAAGNRTRTVLNGVTTLYTTNSLNQYTTVGGVGQTYDADGNLTFDGVNTYTWDQQSRLVRVSGPEGVTEYEYDAFGNRTAKVENGVRTEYLLDGYSPGSVVADFSTSGTTQVHYIHGLGLVARSSPDSSRKYFDFDVNGNVAALTGSDAQQINRYSYNPFGSFVLNVSSESSRFGYMGGFGVTTEEIGRSLMTHHRMLNSDTGRFASVDPARLGGGTNLYAYGINNPVARVDPIGDAAVLAVPLAMLVGSALVGASDTITFSGGFHIPVMAGVQVGQAGAISWNRSDPDQVDIGLTRDWQFGGVADIGFNLDFNWGGEATAGSFGVGIGKYSGFSLGFSQDSWSPVSVSIGVGLGIPILPVTYSIPIPIDGTSGGTDSTPAFGSADPNQKLPGLGFGPQAFVAGGVATPFRIDFENYGPGSVEANGEPAPASRWATSPAQHVTVSDFLSADFDWATFRLTEVGWGDVRLAVPAGSQSYRTTVRMTLNGKAFDVLVEAGLRTATGEVYASFQSLDPASELPPDVLTGFLPPEDGTGRGQGFVSYTVRPDAGLPTGTEIRNVALITFDGQTAIATDQIDPLNPALGVDPAKQARITIDAGRPTSTVAALPANTPTASFTVTWGGADDAGGSGVGFYTVYVSDDGGPFVPFLLNTTDTSAAFTGQDGHTYRFYSVAVDNVGNREVVPAGPQATTQVRLDAPASTVAALPAALNTASFTVSWSGTAGASGSAVTDYKVYVSNDGGAYVLWQQSGAAGSALFTGQDGHTYRFYSVATDAAGNVQPTPATAQATTLVDLTVPSGSVSALPAVTNSATIGLTWTGSDGAAGSGVASFDVFVSDNGGAFQPLLTGATETGTTFTGQTGHTYRFYAVATDRAGNRQPTPAAAHATTLVDTEVPTSSVAALPTFTTAATFTVTWGGSDGPAGSGVAGYRVFVSDDGGPFTLWREASAAGSAIFVGQDGHAYRFYSVATDATGNAQPTPAVQATTIVDATAPASAAAALPAYTSSTSFGVTWSGTDGPAGSGVADFNVYVSDNGGAFALWRQSAVAESAVFAGQDGHTYRFYSVATDAAGNTQPVPAAAQATTLVDVTAPAGSVAALPAVQNTAAVALTWSGSDGATGSGVAAFDVFVSTDGGPFTPFLTGTSLSGTTFTGVTGRRYGFYAVATDRAGNTQPPPAGAQATILVDTTPPTAALAPLSAYMTSAAFPVTWSGSDGATGSGVVAYRVFVSVDGGAYTLWQQAAAPGSATFTGQPGRRYAFSAVATDAAGNTAAAQATTLVDTTAPASGVGPLPASQPAAPFVVNWAGNDGPGGSGVVFYDVYVSTDGGPYQPFASNTAATSATFTGAAGHSYAFYSVATDRAGLREDAPGTPDATTTVTDSPPPPPPAGPSPVLVGYREFAVGVGGGGSATVRAFNPDGSERSARAAFDGGVAGGVRAAVADFTGDGVADVAAGTGPGTPARLRVWDGATGLVLLDAPFFEGFPGGLFVAAGDITGDGKAELVVTPDQGGGPRVTILGGGDFATLVNFFGIDDPNFRGGARAGLGDINGDGSADLVVSAGFGGGPRISVYDGAALSSGQRVHLVSDFFLFEPALRNGAYVAVGDVDGDGMADVVGGAGPGGGPRVLTISGRTLLATGAGAALAVPITNFFAGNVDNRGGVRVAVKNLDGDAKADLVAGDGEGGGSHVTGYAGKDFAGGSAPELFGFDAFAGLTDGVFVG